MEWGLQCISPLPFVGADPSSLHKGFVEGSPNSSSHLRFSGTSGFHVGKGSVEVPRTLFLFTFLDIWLWTFAFYVATLPFQHR